MTPPRLRAPREGGGVLAEPPLAQVAALLAHNRGEFLSARVRILDQPLTELRLRARSEAWAAASRYLAEAGEPLPPAPSLDQPWLLAGHQPDLFHPGVWVKHFALHGLAQAHDGFSLNLVVDNDAAKPPLLHLPAGEHVVSVPYDHWQGESPYEDRRVVDEALFATLPQRIQPHVTGWPFAPLLPALWREAMQQRDATPLLGERIARARRAIERKWGCTQAEVPLSRLCQGEAFACFACHLVSDARRLLTVYNDAVHHYRQRYRLKSTFHPVPDLAEEGDWTELPLWAWRTGQRRRARLFVHSTATEVQLRAGGETWPALKSGGDLLEQWRTLEAGGFKVRTRALTTTLFARLLLGDLFIHGIGGAKYDELADVLIARFFGCPVPAFLTLSATLLLPLPRYPVNGEMCRAIGRQHRDLWYNPQRYFPEGQGSMEAAQLVRAKQAWIGRATASRAERKARFVALRGLNDRLRAFLFIQEEALRHQRDQCRERVRINAVLGRRDYAFCLYPEAMLCEFMQRFQRATG